MDHIVLTANSFKAAVYLRDMQPLNSHFWNVLNNLAERSIPKNMNQEELKLFNKIINNDNELSNFR
ncbi:hypothetical protein PCC6912_40300 [Chlorogloeopsis fritschii PCC 6912]|uniref:Uncharacterized protein n=1 Tax=Chlorogloeopsis fritschii PCC 6912 TaxID=211165 RepID=A0A433N6M4_CHLFR|nr:hypothetical protein PCC6912_40300 [Chlorogloeopsis fritschii PCC 6912]